MTTEPKVKLRPRELVCTLPKDTLRALLLIARDPAERVRLDRIHINPAEGRLVAATPHMMLWVRMNMPSKSEPFTLSGVLCEAALGAAQKTLTIHIDSVQQDARRRISITAPGMDLDELENLGPYPDPRTIFAVQPDTRTSDVDPAALAHLRSAISLVVANKHEPVHVVNRGSAPAMVVCRSPYVLGFITPWEATLQGDRWTTTTLREFGLAPSDVLPPTRTGRLRVALWNGTPPTGPGDQAA